MIEQTYTNQDKIYGVAYVNAGQNYTDATLPTTGNDKTLQVLSNEFRDGAVSEFLLLKKILILLVVPIINF